MNGLSDRQSKTAEVHTQRPRYKYSVLKSLCLYNIPNAYTNSHCHASSSLLFTCCMWTRLLLASHPLKFLWSHLQPAANTIHVITLPSSMPPNQFTRPFTQEHQHLVYFRYQVHFLLFSFNQGPTSTTASTDVKGIFKSISNTSRSTLTQNGKTCYNSLYRSKRSVWKLFIFDRTV